MPLVANHVQSNFIKCSKTDDDDDTRLKFSPLGSFMLILLPGNEKKKLKRHG